MNLKAAALNISLIFFSCSIFAEEPISVSGTYGDFTCHNSQGDILGTEISFIRGIDGSEYKTYAIVQFSEGVPKKPEIVEVVFDGDYVTFEVSYMGYFNTNFKGKIISEVLEGAFSKPLDMTINLRKSISYWHANDKLCGGYN
jgi:hypothetical protein